MDSLTRRISKSHNALWRSINRKVPSGAKYNRTLEDRATERIALAIARAGSASRKIGRKYARDVSFHLVDWYADLERLRAVIRQPDAFTDKEIGTVVTAFMLHAPHHIAAAHKIHEEEAIRDVFELGIHENGPPRKSACPGPPMPKKRRAVKQKSRAAK